MLFGKEDIQFYINRRFNFCARKPSFHKPGHIYICGYCCGKFKDAHGLLGLHRELLICIVTENYNLRLAS